MMKQTILKWSPRSLSSLLSLLWDNQRGTGNVVSLRTITSHFILICDQLHFAQFTLTFTSLFFYLKFILLSFQYARFKFQEWISLFFKSILTQYRQSQIRKKCVIHLDGEWVYITLCEQQNSRMYNVIFRESNEWFKYRRKVLMIYWKLLDTFYRISIDLTLIIMYFLTTWVWY